MLEESPQHLIFTDMDGTLLDHFSYSHAAALPALELCKQRQIPVIPNTSKTFAEMQLLREQCGLAGPFVIENGAAIYIPHGFLPQKPAGAIWKDGYWCKSFGQPRSHWLLALQNIESNCAFDFTSFSKMSIGDIMQSTGLTYEQADLAAQRDFSEPVKFRGTDQEKLDFIKAVEDKGAQVLEGGRFLHISGATDKAKPMLWLAETLKQQHKLSHLPQMIALGDGKNDVDMLRDADIAVRILSPVHEPPEVLSPRGKLRTSTKQGPEGWSEMILKLIDKET